MHRSVIGIAVAAAALMAAIQSSRAQTDFPFGSRPWCMSGSRSNGGMPQCAYYTLAQCRGALQGGSDHCYENPTLVWYRDHGMTQGKQKQGRAGKRTY